MKNCNNCKIPKDYIEFNKNKTIDDGYSRTCRLCMKIINNKSYKNNRESSNLKSKEWYKNNKRKHITHMLEYKINNPEVSKKASKKWNKNNREYFKKWNKNQWDNNPNFKLRRVLSIRLNDLLRNHNINKNHPTLKLLKCSLEFFKKYISLQFKPEMSWENWGPVWELDHIIPCFSFDLTKEEDQKQCFHYTNFQPLFKTTEIAQSFGYQNEIGNRNKSKS